MINIKHIIGRVYCTFKGHELPLLIEHLGDVTIDNREHFLPLPMESRRIYCQRCNKTSSIFRTGVTIQGALRIIDGEIVIVEKREAEL